ncbi:MAG: YmdB family metallophosphoesterase [Eubacterium sp.]|nr:YmdB family metallophosphoesterase [Eubacterium sp.]MCM1418305.1 YmdB family metallophosphoesterase [Roseburia sp.]
MNVLFIGDVVGQSSVNRLIKRLPNIKREYEIHVTVVNGENSANGNGITPFSANLLLSGGTDVITTGNHCFRRSEMMALYEESDVILRPANLGDTYGKGVTIFDMGKTSLAVINLMGRAFMDPCDNPFFCADRILEKLQTPNILVDFHAEATSEKKAMGFYLAGRVSAVLGTHTHVQTADEEILNDHTGYLTDVGMTGIRQSVLGIDKDIIIMRLTSYLPQKHTYPEEGDFMINGAVLSIDETSGRCLSIQRINL